MYYLHHKGRRVSQARTRSFCLLHGYCLLGLLTDSVDKGTRTSETSENFHQTTVFFAITAFRTSIMCLIYPYAWLLHFVSRRTQSVKWLGYTGRSRSRLLQEWYRVLFTRRYSTRFVSLTINFNLHQWSYTSSAPIRLQGSVLISLYTAVKFTYYIYLIISFKYFMEICAV